MSKFKCIYMGKIMAGSVKWFVYTDDAGQNWGIRLDESNTEAVNAGNNDLIDGASVPYALPRNVKPRNVVYANANRTRRIRCVVLTPTIYSGILNNGVPTIPDPIAGTGTLGLLEFNAEKRTALVPFDTGLNDGDET